MADRSTQARTVGAQGGAAVSAGSADGAALVGVDVGDALVGAMQACARCRDLHVRGTGVHVIATPTARERFSEVRQRHPKRREA